VSNDVTVKLREAVQLGSEKVEELVLKPTARFFKDLEVTAGADGLKYKPYDLAVIGVRLAGRPAAAALVDKMHPGDMQEVANVVLGFLGPSPETGESA
jgi:hypothetical protein